MHRWHRIVMGADSRGHTAQALWSAFARRTLWPDSRSGGPDLWRRLQCYPRFRDQGASVFPSERCEEVSVCAAKAAFTESLLNDPGFAEVRASSATSLNSKWALSTHGLKARQLLRDYVHSYTLVDTLVVCHDESGDASTPQILVYDIDLPHDELAEAQAEHQRQRDARLAADPNSQPPENTAERAKLLHSIEFNNKVRGELLPSGAYQEVETLRIDGDLLAFQAKRSDKRATEVWDIREPSSAAPIYRTRDVDQIFNKRELWTIEMLGSTINPAMYDLRSPDPACTVNTITGESLFVNDQFVALGHSRWSPDPNVVQVFDRRNLDTPVVSHEQHTYLVTDVAMTSDNRKVVSCAWDGRLLVTDVASGETKSLNLHAKLGQMQLITDRVLAVADVMCAVSFVDLDTMEFLRGYEVTPMGCGNNCTLEVNETKLAAGMANGSSGCLAVFDLALDTARDDVCMM
ncbi:uncharacterized protein ACA1_061070 [Acanthamoeba castellanii str. Neff]|uniref:Uncharacterized protein n=1 Tax=Acanthamoeba castellanii (strain ATCC 30010 / Neff) TaxID=1257118 RepID=L8GVV6_ACACF|nr:uncharacterized protein ACA1_061070 [Acanthamoeba castellanii str. Neff]ELR17369.1 hypothetical protein ACA1_061070 [Acanthamoeba castellanii str. Neff]